VSALDPTLIPRGFRGRLGPRGLELYRDPDRLAERRLRGVITSLHRDIRAGSRLRIRRIVSQPSELFRLELERSDLACQRTTLLDADALELLLEELGEEAVAQSVDFR
jgi:hypothetical protein